MSHDLIPQSIAQIKIGKHTYPIKSVATCTVCQSPHRLTIERELAYGNTYKSVLTMLEDADPPGPSAEAMARHVNNGHMPIQQTSQRVLIERRATEMGRDIANGVENLLDAVSVNQAIIERGFRRLQDGDIEPSMNELLQALKLQAQIDAATPSGSVDNEVWTEALMEAMAIAKRIMPPELWNRFGMELATSPVMKAIQGQVASVPGEVVDE